MGVHLGVWGFFHSHSFALLGHENVTPGLSLGPHPCKPFCLGHEPKARVATKKPTPHYCCSSNQCAFGIFFNLKNTSQNKNPKHKLAHS
jgi:hypothetical protein